LIVRYNLVRDGIENKRTPRLTRSRPYDLEALIYSDLILYPETGRSLISKGHSGTVEFLRTPPPEFAEAHQRVGTFTFSRWLMTARDSFTTTLIKRIKPVSLEEVEASIANIDLPEEYEYQSNAALSRAYAAEGNTEMAIQFYRKVQNGTATPSMKSTTRNRLIKEFVAHAKTYRSQRDTAQAIALYEAVLQLDGQNRAAGNALRQLKEQK